MRRFIFVLAGLAVLALAGTLRADVLRLRDGRVLEGRLISQDNNKVVFEINRAGLFTRMEFRDDEVMEVKKGEAAPSERPAPRPAATRPSPATASPAAPAPTTAAPEPTPPPIVAMAGPSYYRIPLRGEIGVYIIAPVLDKALADAALRKPTAVVIEMDSPGGLIQEVGPLVEVINKHRKSLRIIVLAKEAISAAAITSLAVDEIYMRPTAVFGAATAYKLSTVTGLPQNIDEKMQSIWRATARSAAEVGRHPTALAEAMIDNQVALYATGPDGAWSLTTSPMTGGRIVKPRGRLLTLTAKEAVQFGLARGVVDDIAALGVALKYPGWKECAGLGVPLAEHWTGQIEAAEKEMRAIRDRFEKAMKNADLNDPSSFKDYFVLGDTQRFTDESARKWAERSRRCMACLAEAERELKKAGELAERFPQLMPPSEMFEDLRKAIADARQRIQVRSKQ